MTAEQVLVQDDAAYDLEQGINFYEIQKDELGSYFFDALIADIASLRITAGVHPVHLGLHRMLCRHFPFAIYYSYDGKVARVIAILDMRWNPAWTRDQLDNRN
jgi:hypothetical protein